MEGPLQGREIGTTEIAGLGIVKLHSDGTMTAKYINAVHGAQYIDDVYDYPDVVRQIGINRVLEPSEIRLEYSEHLRKWVDAETKAVVGFAGRVTLLHGNVFYRPHNEVTNKCQEKPKQPEQPETFITKLKSLVSRN